MKITIVILCFIVFNCKGQKATGNYLMINQWSISHILLKKNGSAKWYTRGCTNRGTEKIGTWTQNSDTLSIMINKKTTFFILRKKTLCHLEETGELTEVNYGIPKTYIRSKWRIHLKAKRLRRKVIPT